MKFSPITSNEPKHALTKMNVNFISLCGAGINPLANVAFAKADDGEGETFSKMGPTASEVHSDKPMGSDECEEKKGRKAKQKMHKGESTLTGVHIHTVVNKSTDHLQGDDMPNIELPDGTPESVAEYVAKLEKALTDTEDQLAKAQEALDAGAEPTPVTKADSSDDDIEAALAKADPAVAALLRKQADELAKAKADADSAKTVAASLAKAQAETAALAKAETYDVLGTETSEVAKTIAELRATNAELAKSVEALLDSAVAKVSESPLLDEIGVTAVTKSGPKLEAAVASIRKSDPSLSPEQAMAKAITDDPSLYKAYIENQES